MTNPLPQPGPADSRPADLPSTGTAEVSSAPVRKAPRRATAPAGSPTRTDVPALMVLDASGAVLTTGAPTVPEADDAGGPVASESSTAAVVVEAGAVADPLADPDAVAGTEAESESEPEASEATEAPAVEVVTEPDVETKDAEPAAVDAEVEAAEIKDAGVEAKEASALSVAAAESLPESTQDSELGAPAVSADEMDATPQSRRERRMAEQQHGFAAVTAATGTQVAPEDAAVEVVEPVLLTAPIPLARQVKKRNRSVGALRGLLFLLVIAALVLTMGTVRSGNNDPTAGPSQTEAHRQAAWENTSALLQQVEGVRSGGEDQKLVQLLADVGEDLDIQLAALGDGLPPATATASAPAGTDVPATLEQLVAGLQTNGAQLLDNAVSADHAMGRVFAAAGTSQLLQGRALGAAAALTPQGTPWLPATVNFPAPSGPKCSSTLEPRPGATVDAALIAAAEGEQKAVYAYEVATPRMTNPQFHTAEQLLAGHQEKLAQLNAELQVRCLPALVPAPGYAVNPEFTSAPSTALAELEQQLAANYADLAALTTAPVSVATDPAPGATAGPLPAAITGATLEANAGSAATAENTSMLRQMSVTWLLDSTESALLWGGEPSALPGLERSPATAAP